MASLNVCIEDNSARLIVIAMWGIGIIRKSILCRNLGDQIIWADYAVRDFRIAAPVSKTDIDINANGK